MAKTAGCGFGLRSEYVMLVALVHGGSGCMFVLHFHAKMHLRFGSKAVDTGRNERDVKGKQTAGGDSDKIGQIKTFLLF